MAREEDEWLPFTLGRSAGRIGKPKIGIQINGRFGINAAAQQFLGNYVLLMTIRRDDKSVFTYYRR